MPPSGIDTRHALFESIQSSMTSNYRHGPILPSPINGLLPTRRYLLQSFLVGCCTSDSARCNAHNDHRMLATHTYLCGSAGQRPDQREVLGSRDSIRCFKPTERQEQQSPRFIRLCGFVPLYPHHLPRWLQGYCCACPPMHAACRAAPIHLNARAWADHMFQMAV